MSTEIVSVIRIENKAGYTAKKEVACGWAGAVLWMGWELKTSNAKKSKLWPELATL